MADETGNGSTDEDGKKGKSVKAAPTPAKRRRHNTDDFTFTGEPAPY